MKKSKQTDTPKESLTKESIEMVDKALKFKNEALQTLKESVEIESNSKLLSNKQYVDFLIKKEKVLVLKGLLTASHGQSEFFGLVAPDAKINPVYSDDDSLHIKAKIQEIIKTF
jgi:hypothetical protein